MSRARHAAAGALLSASVAALAACGGAASPPAPPVAPRGPEPAGQAADPLGVRPGVPPPSAFTPPTPEIFKAANGMTIWLVERHTLPIVAATLSIPYGASSDPSGKAGVAFMTADMIDEGAGARDAVALSTAVSDLGASLGTGAGIDGSSVALAVLKKNFRAAFAIFADVVARPRFEDKEWKRVSSLWRNGLEKRAQDPGEVARVLVSAAVYGPSSVYGHPSDGLASTAGRVDSSDVKAFYASHYRPDKATLVVVGDVTRAEVASAVDASLGSWTATGAPPALAPAPRLREAPPRLVLVDRPEAAQSVIAVVRDGVAASDPSAPLLQLVNTALGGSFTSRLNQDLREEHGWSYGAGSAFTETRRRGAFVARASVMTEATGQALTAMLGDLDAMAGRGLSDEEVDKVKAQDRAELVEAYQSVGGIARRLAMLATLGLSPDFDARASRARQDASKPGLDRLANAVSPSRATIIVVGPAARVAPQLAAAGFGAPVLWDPEGSPVPSKR